MTMRFAFLLACTLGLIMNTATAHEGHDHGPVEGVETGFKPFEKLNGRTGSKPYRFKYNAELSKLPKEIADKIAPAHGGFAKTPNGDLYFGLRRSGLIRMSADLKTKEFVSTDTYFTSGGMHNCAYLDRDGGLLVIPDDQGSRVLFVDLEGNEVKTLGKPPGYPKGTYKPTDLDIASNGKIYVADGYGSTKKVYTIDSETMEYTDLSFGGRVGAGRTEGKFSTSHGVTFDPTDDTIVVADRERQWAQKFDLDGNFLEGFDMARHNPCDVDFVDYNGERLMVAGCLTGPDQGVVQILKDGKVVSSLRPKQDLGLNQFRHVHNAAGVVVGDKLYVICYGWNPGCFAVLEHLGFEKP